MGKSSFWLMLWFVTVFLVGGIFFAADARELLRTRLLDIADADLEARALDLQHLLEADKNLSPPDLRSQIAERYKIEDSRDCVQITEAGGNPVYVSKLFSSHLLPVLSPDDLDRRIYRDYAIGSESYRLVSQQVELPGRALIIWIARPMNLEADILSSIRRSQIGYWSVALLIAVAGGYWISRRSRM
jgi:uncharacterized protein YneF (UPF0154 family)